MKLKDGMLLYHGSYLEINTIDLQKGSPARDFGKGFYLTSDSEQARSFIKSSIRKAEDIGVIPPGQNYGFVTVFRYTDQGENLSVYEFASADKEWLWYISSNRRAKLSALFQGRMNTDLKNADIFIGKVANDTTNRVLAAYLNGLYGDIASDEAAKIAIMQLMPERLVDQFCFRSEKAVRTLQKVETIKYGF